MVILIRDNGAQCVGTQELLQHDMHRYTEAIMQD